MANKALARRQKMTLRVEPSGKGRGGLKPRNPLAVPAKQRAAGPHRKTTSGQRLKQERDLQKQLRSEPENSD